MSILEKLPDIFNLLLQPKVLLIVAIAGGALLVLPDEAIVALGLDGIEKAGRPWIGGAVLFSVAGLLVHIMVWIPQTCTNYRKQRLAREYPPIGALLIQDRLPRGTLRHAGVVWRMTFPAPSLFDDNAPLDIEAVQLDNPPLCPECNTELSETTSWSFCFRLRFRWSCARCQFRKVNRHSFTYEQSVGTRLARSHLLERLRAQR